MHNEDLSRKSNEFNEFMLKQAAITFSMEGISRDLKIFLQKKVNNTKFVLEKSSEMYTAMICSDIKSVRESILNKDHPINKLLEHSLKEVQVTDVVLNLIIQNILNKESLLASEKNKKMTVYPEEGEANE